MRIILVLCCCIVLGACKETWLVDEIPRDFRLIFLDNQGNSLIQDSTQKVFIYDEREVAQPVNLHTLNTNVVITFPLFEKEMNQEFSFEIPSLDYQGNFVMRRSNSERAILYFNEQEIHNTSNDGIPLYILELPL